MAEKYEEGKDYLLLVKISVSHSENDVWPIKIIFNNGGDKDCYTGIKDEPGLLLTESEVAALVHYRKNMEKEERLAALEKENADLKEQVNLLKAEIKDWRSKYMGVKINRNDYKKLLTS